MNIIFSGQECKDTWTKLRNAYTNALKRRKTTSGQAAKKIMKWKFEDQMSFLSPYMEPRTSQNSFQSQTEPNIENDTESAKNRTDDVETQNAETSDGDQAASTSLTSVPEVSEVLTNSNNSEAINVRANPSSFSRTATSRKRIEKSMTELVDIMKSNNRIRSQIMQPPRPPAVPDDDIDLFFKSLAKSVKRLPQNEQVRLKMGISNLVFEAELKNISPVTQSQVITITMPQSSPVLSSSVLSSSANSYSIDSESFVQSPSSEHYFPHNDENLQPIPHYSEDNEGTNKSRPQNPTYRNL